MRQRLLNACLLAAVLGLFALPAFANNDIVQFGSSIHVAPDSSVHDAVCFFCDVDDRGTVQGDIVVFFGSVHIAGNANHDVVNFFGTVKAEDNSTIGNDLVSMFGLRAASTVTVGGDRVVQPGWILWGPLLIIALVIIVVVREYRSYRRRLYLRGYPFPPKP